VQKMNSSTSKKHNFVLFFTKSQKLKSKTLKKQRCY